MTELDQGLVKLKRFWLCLEPVDTLFFRDGRPFDPASRAISGLPNPQVLAGALRTEMLRCADIDFARLGDCIRNGHRFEAAARQVGGSLGEQIAKTNFRGPYLGRKNDIGKQDRLFYSAPATLRHSIKEGAEDKIVRLDPLCASQSLPGWQPNAQDMVPLWTRDKSILKPLDEIWITSEGLSAFLSGKTPKSDELVSSDDLYGFEDRTGIAIDPDIGTTQEGMIYATRRLVLRSGMRFWAQVEGPTEALDLLPRQDECRLLPFGGEGRQVAVTSCNRKDGPLTACAEPAQNPENGRCLVLITPALLNGWHPSGLDLLSAAVPGHVPVSGWDLARGGPKPTRFSVKAGSVYFLSPNSKRSQGSGLGDIHDTSLGWGEYCEGVWHHASNL
ncbi:type III-B CRISPR module-associated Cmr3 family protein [Ruegeria sp.]|uniref:type III-B CRISPR module-associated Cmr3 family protein n=1 Tax=Ruegeria sp. TaxID=1879320 RepID=UPI003C7CBC70